jgi:hypothetical protein
VESKLSTLRDIEAGVPHVSVLYPTFYTLYINDNHQTLRVSLGLIVNDACVYATDRKESYILRKLQRGLRVVETRCELFNMKMNEDEIQDTYCSYRQGTLKLILH